MKTTAEETQELLKIALAPAAYTQDIVEYIKAISNEWTEHFETYSQTEYIDDAEFLSWSHSKHGIRHHLEKPVQRGMYFQLYMRIR